MSKTKDIPSAIPEEAEKQNSPKLQELHDQVGPSPEQVLPKMEVSRFLEQSQQHRLYLLTGNTNVEVGKQLTVDFHGNTELEREITAGHILPPEVREITIDGIVGTRKGVKGEFYADNGAGKRLTILTDTVVTISKYSAHEEIAALHEEIDGQVSQFESDKQVLARAALERGVNPTFMIAAQESLGRGYDNVTGVQNAEMIATVIGRDRGRFQQRFPDIKIEDNNELPPQFVGYVLYRYGQEDFEKVAKQLGYTEEQKQSAQQFGETAYHMDPELEALLNSDPIKALKREIAATEGGYDSYNRGTAGVSGAPLDKPPSSMTIGEVMSLQRVYKNGDKEKGLFACGKYQFIPSTLRGAVTFVGLSPNDLFSAENQEKMFAYLISAEKRPNAYAYLTGRSSNLQAAQMDLAREFASLPMPNGKGYYDGDTAGNMASGGTDRAQKVATILQAVRNYNLTNPGEHQFA